MADAAYLAGAAPAASAAAGGAVVDAAPSPPGGGSVRQLVLTAVKRARVRAPPPPCCLCRDRDPPNGRPLCILSSPAALFVPLHLLIRPPPPPFLSQDLFAPDYSERPLPDDASQRLKIACKVHSRGAACPPSPPPPSPFAARPALLLVSSLSAPCLTQPDAPPCPSDPRRVCGR